MGKYTLSVDKGQSWLRQIVETGINTLLMLFGRPAAGQHKHSLCVICDFPKRRKSRRAVETPACPYVLQHLHTVSSLGSWTLPAPKPGGSNRSNTLSTTVNSEQRCPTLSRIKTRRRLEGPVACKKRTQPPLPSSSFDEGKKKMRRLPPLQKVPTSLLFV